jgi:hypothetical protein
VDAATQKRSRSAMDRIRNYHKSKNKENHLHHVGGFLSMHHLLKVICCDNQIRI